MGETSDTYEFVFRGLLAEEAVEAVGLTGKSVGALESAEVEKKLSLDSLDEIFVSNAMSMAPVYVAIAAFENSAREFVTKVLRDENGDEWWEKCVSDKTRKHCASRAEEEKQNRFHTQRGDAPVNYTELKHLANIIRANEDAFSDFVVSPEWVTAVFDAVERSRNVIMHSGTLDPEDIERLGMNIRDWVKQVGV